jgi:hypothetical protein
MITRYGRQRMRALFLHSVFEQEGQVDPHSLSADRRLNGVPVLYFRTYVGAAAKAANVGLMRSDGVARVINQARRELQEIDPPPAGRRYGSSSRWRELERDVERALDLLPALRGKITARRLPC